MPDSSSNRIVLNTSNFFGALLYSEQYLIQLARKHYIMDKSKA